MDEIMVSVICFAYNHEKYIRKCLEGFVMQKTTFRFEVLIHDDASTDRTADIIREYEAKYPEIIKPIYQTDNQYSKHIGIAKTFLLPNAKGKYIAWCEGDDYWIDENKLQLQYEAMECNPECSLCVHRVQGIKEDGEVLVDRRFPDGVIINHTGIIEQNEFFSIIIGSYQFQTSSYFAKLERYLEYINNPPEFERVSDVGDEPMLLFFGNEGPVFYIDEVMSHYRIGSIGSWSSRIRYDKEKQLVHVRAMIKMYQLFNVYSNNVYQHYIEKVVENYHIREKQLTLSSKVFLLYMIKENKLQYPKTHRLRFYTRLILEAYFPVLLTLLLNIKRRVKQNGKNK